MKRSDRKCSVPACDNPSPQEYPFCHGHWVRVPPDLALRVREEIAKRGTPDLDRSALYYAVTEAATVAADAPQWTSATLQWERAWRAAGSPELEVVG